MLERRQLPLELCQPEWWTAQNTLTLCEKIRIAMYQLAAHSRGGQLAQRIDSAPLRRADRDLFYLVDCHSRRSSKTFDDCLRADALLDMVFNLFQYFSS